MQDNYYRLLGVSMQATEAEIKAAYKRLAVLHHPDKNNGSTEHEEIFKRIAEAYQILSDYNKRKAYDFKLVYGILGSISNQAKAAAYNYSRPRSFRRRPPIDPYLDLKARSATIAFLVFSMLFWYFFRGFMDRITAAEHVMNGYYESALIYDNQNADAYFMRAEKARNRYMNYNAAIADYNLAEKYAKQANADLYFARGLCLLETQQYDRALKDFEKTVTLQPANDTAQFYIANILTYAYNDFDKGLDAFEKTLSIRPNFYEALFGKGYCLLQINQPTAALATFNKGIKINPLDEELLYYRGFTFFALKDSASACSDWNEALNMGKIEAREAMHNVCKIR